MDVCDRAITQLQHYLNAADRPHAELDAALRHIVACPHCRRNVRRLRAALLATAIDQLSCADCEGLLPPYLLAEESGAPPDPAWADLRLHLATCPRCGDDYLALRELGAIDATAEPAPPAPGLPDLSFLPHRAAPAQGPIDQLRRLVVAFSADLLAAMRAAVSPAPALALKSARGPQPIGRLEAGDPAGLSAQLTLAPYGDDPAQCALRVAVSLPGRRWPDLAGVTIRLDLPGAEPQIRLSDAAGHAEFAPLPLAALDSITLTMTTPA